MLKGKNHLATELCNTMLESMDNSITDELVKAKDDTKTIAKFREELRDILVEKVRDTLDQSALALVGFIRGASKRETMDNATFEEFAQEYKERLIEINSTFDKMKLRMKGKE